MQEEQKGSLSTSSNTGTKTGEEPEKHLNSSPPGLFFRDPRISAIFRFLVFLSLIRFVLVPLAFAAVQPFRRTIESMVGDISEAVLLTCVLLLTFIMARLEGRSLLDYGLGGARGFSKFGIGALVGFVSLTSLLVGLWSGRVFQFGPVHMHGLALASGAANSALGFALVALYEETAFRGYPMYTLMRAIQFWPAAVVMSLIFAWEHTGNPGESAVGIVAVFFFGMVLAFSVWRTGSLLWAIGFHFIWDYSETFIYGVPDSGFVSPQHLLSARLTGPAWMTGGSVGPEGSYFIFVVLAAVAAVVHFLYPRTELKEMLA